MAVVGAGEAPAVEVGAGPLPASLEQLGSVTAAAIPRRTWSMSFIGDLPHLEVADSRCRHRLGTWPALRGAGTGYGCS
jgi:hypothetical protein